MLKLALIGKSISHSRSQEMYEKLLGEKVDYTLLDYEASDKIPSAETLLSQYMGISITAPYKEHFLNQVIIDHDVSPLGAINCLALKDGKVHGTNTDYLALKQILKKYQDRKIIILGRGAMFRVCSKVLKDVGKDFLSYSRKTHGDISRLDLTEYENSIVINTCARSYVFGGVLNSSTIFYDLNYSFKEHFDHFSQVNIQYIDGLELLELQAKYALEFWNL